MEIRFLEHCEKAGFKQALQSMKWTKSLLECMGLRDEVESSGCKKSAKIA